MPEAYASIARMGNAWGHDSSSRFLLENQPFRPPTNDSSGLHERSATHARQAGAEMLLVR